jgi:bacterial leucyl aminopeptidase
LYAETFPSKLTYTSKKLNSLFEAIDLKEMKTFLTAFSGFRTRYYRSETGKVSPSRFCQSL